MDVTAHKLYLYEHVWEVLAVDDNSCLLCGDNGPMNNVTPIKVHKGIDNKVLFRALAPDRSPVNLACTEEVYARIIDPENRSIVLEKLCRQGPATGMIRLELNAGDLIDFAPGHYELTLIRSQEFVSNIPDVYIDKPLYSDINDNVAMSLIVTEQGFKAPLDSITFYPTDWIKGIHVPLTSGPKPYLYTPRIPGARVQNHKNAVHTFSTFTLNATGVLEIFGTLDETPDPYLNDSRWFKIYPSALSQDIEYTGYTGTVVWSFQANCMWLKFRYTPSQSVLDPGILQKLIVRT